EVAQAGEVADECLGGYPWFKIHKLVNYLDVIPGLPLSDPARRVFLKVSGAPQFPWSMVRRIRDAIGGKNAWLEPYALMSMSKLRLFSPAMLELATKDNPYLDLNLNLERMRRWHPFNRSLCIGARVM